MKILVLGNCQISSIVDLLRATTCNPQIRGISAFNINTEHREKYIKLINDSDIIFTQPIFNNPFEFLLTQELISKAKTYVFPNLYINYYHPDVCYLGVGGDRINSPLGNYNSIIIVKSFLEGKDEKFAESSFNHEIFKRFNYYLDFDTAIKPIIERNLEFNSQIGDLLEKFKKNIKSPFMYTLNHPNIHALSIIAEDLLERADLKIQRKVSDIISLLPDHLNQHSVWPVYPEIGEKIGVKGSYLFRNSISSGNQIFSLKEMIRRSYLRYKSIDRNKLVPNNPDAKKLIFETKFD